MTGEAKTGARIRPIGASGIHNAGAGSEKVRAAGGKGFGMLGHAGSHGRSQVARVPTGGVTPDTTGMFGCCFDLFDRTEASGWGESLTFIAPWSFDPGSSADNAANVDGRRGIISLPAQDYGWATASVGFDYDPDPTSGSLPMEMVVKFRLASTIGSGEEPYLYFDWIHDGTGGLTEAIFADVIIEDERFVSVQAYDVRSSSRAADSGEMPEWVSGAWYWARIYVDAWGTYIRAWKDGQDEFTYLAPVTSYSPTGSAGKGERWTAYDWDDAGRPSVTFSAFAITAGAPYAGDAFAYQFDEVLARYGACDRWEACACGSDPDRQWPTIPSTLYWDEAPFGEGPIYGYTRWLPGGDVAGFVMTRDVENLTVLWKCKVPTQSSIPIGYGGYAWLMKNDGQVDAEYYLSPGGPASPFWPQVQWPASSDLSYASWTGNVSAGDVFTVMVDHQPLDNNEDPVGTYYGQQVCLKAYLP